MTEREAWNWCAEQWDGATNEGDAHRPNWKSARWTTGICGCVGWLLSTGRVTAETGCCMYDKIEALPGLQNRQTYPFFDYTGAEHAEYISEFKFPRTEEGAKQRAAWCRKMAEECDK